MRVALVVLAATGLGIAGAAATLVLAAPATVVEALQRWEPEVLWSVDTDRPAVALTIDDGPSAGTEAILEVLAEHDARATFFLIGERVEANPAMVRRIVEAGHEIANHTMVEAPSVRMPEARFRESLERTDALLDPWGEARWFRPGSGWYDEPMLEAARAQGYRTALASMLPVDGWLPWAPLVAGYVVASARPGAILVLHDGRGRAETTAEVLRRALPELERRGYAVTTVSGLERLADGDAR